MTVPVTVKLPDLGTLALVAAPNAAVWTGTTIQLAAKGIDVNGADRAVAPTWSTNPATIATVDQLGEVTIHAAGAFEVASEEHQRKSGGAGGAAGGSVGVSGVPPGADGGEIGGDAGAHHPARQLAYEASTRHATGAESQSAAGAIAQYTCTGWRQVRCEVWRAGTTSACAHSTSRRATPFT